MSGRKSRKKDGFTAGVQSAAEQRPRWAETFALGEEVDVDPAVDDSSTDTVSVGDLTGLTAAPYGIDIPSEVPGTGGQAASRARAWSAKEPKAATELCPGTRPQHKPVGGLSKVPKTPDELVAASLETGASAATGTGDGAAWPRPYRDGGGTEGLQHRCNEGDSLPSIAQRYGVKDWRAIQRHPYNGWIDDPHRVPSGSIVFVPASR